ncbi:hypothetical protein MB02_10445 [Croceicoccus estronivorus]|uniref:helix-turn-helix transcriptional regulator n=1 Tax=Croceicoccus estronivorus TaxID=1172626 RepID=UPI00082D2F67|nr:response regulator transcription factor [Croceicoccus estronivorus]OCC23584.1 hypothetical protein MB02_10445 [Croceicoccus estronivorus]
MHTDMIEAILDAPLADRPWSPLFPALNRLAGGMRCMIRFAPSRMPQHDLILTNEDDSPSGLVQMYREEYCHKDPVSYEGLVPGNLYGFDDLIDRSTLSRSEFYQDFCKPFGMHHAFFSYLGRFDGVDAWLNGVRDRPFQPREWGDLKAAQPFVSTAARYFVRMQGLGRVANALGQACDHLGAGVVLVDSRGRIVDCNVEARDILIDAGIGVAHGGPLRLPSEGAGFLSDVLDNGNAHAAKRITAFECLGHPVHVVARRVEQSALRLATEPAAVIHLRREQHDIPADAIERIAAHFSLSQSEARLCLLLANGLSLVESADQMGLTVETARTYCKRAFAKTDTTRQSELIRLILNNMPLLTKTQH